MARHAFTAASSGLVAANIIWRKIMTMQVDRSQSISQSRALAAQPSRRIGRLPLLVALRRAATPENFTP